MVVLCAYPFNNAQLLLTAGIGEPYDPATGKGVVGKNYCHQTTSGVLMFVDDEINPFIGTGTSPAAIDDFQGDNFDHGGLGFFGGGFIAPAVSGGRPIQVRALPGHPRFDRGVSLHAPWPSCDADSNIGGSCKETAIWRFPVVAGGRERTVPSTFPETWCLYTVAGVWECWRSKHEHTGRYSPARGNEMARGIHRLTPLKVAKLRRPGLYADGGCLFLQVSLGAHGQVRRSWLFRYAISGKQRQSSSGRSYQPVRCMGLGSLDTFGLSEARDMARTCRQLIAQGKDPIEERNAERGRKLAESVAAMNFDQAVEDYVRQHQAGWSVGNRNQFVSSLNAYASPIIGKLPVGSIETSHVMKVLNPIWTEKTATASKVRGRIESVLAFCTVSGFRSGPNPAQWKNHLDKLLPAIGNISQVKHVAALSYSVMPEFMAQLSAKSGLPALALQFGTCQRL
jgi:hypothetical protein